MFDTHSLLELIASFLFTNPKGQLDWFFCCSSNQYVIEVDWCCWWRDKFHKWLCNRIL